MGLPALVRTREEAGAREDMSCKGPEERMKCVTVTLTPTLSMLHAG